MKEIQLTRGKVTIVNENDYKILSLHKWYYCSGYAVREVKGKSIRMHRIILEAKELFGEFAKLNVIGENNEIK